MSKLKELLNGLDEGDLELLKEMLIPFDTKEEKKKPQKVENDFTVKKGENPHQRTPVKAKVNTWVDSGENRNPEDNKIQMGVVKSSRPKAEMIEITCSVCSRKVKVPSSLPRTEYYRCERCVG